MVRRKSGPFVLTLALLTAARAETLQAQGAEVVELLAHATSDSERAGLLETRKAEITPDVAATLLERGKALVQREPAEALGFLEASRAVARRLDQRTVLAAALHAIGVIYASRDDLDLAETAYRESLALRQELKDQAGMGETLGQLGVLLSKRGDYDGALAFYEQALPVAEAAGNKVEIATTLNNIGNVHNGKGEHDIALRFFERSAEVAEAAGNKARLAIAFNNIGLVHQKRGDYLSALRFFEQSIVLKQELGNKVGVAISDLNIGELYREQGNDALALSFLQKALEIFVAADVKTGIAIGLNNMGLMYRARGELDRAQEVFERALSQSEALKDKVGMAEALGNIGRVLESRGEYKPALGRYQESLAFSEEAGDRMRIAQNLISSAQVHVAAGTPAEAQPLLERAIAVTQESGQRELLWRAHTTQGLALRDLGHPARAQQAFEAAVAVIEGLRGQVAGGEAQSERAFEEKVTPYAAMVELLASRGDTEAALAYAERAKARVLLDVLRSGRVSASGAMTPQERERERGLEQDLVALNTQISGERARTKPDATRSATLQGRLSAARLELEAFQASLYSAHPQLAIQRGQTRALDRSDLDALVPDARTALLEYVVTDKAAVLFLATRVANAVVLESYAIAVDRTALGERVRRLRERIASRNLTFGKDARALYDLLLSPAAAHLRGKSRLVIVPDGPLWELPFQALVAHSGRFLIEDASVAYAPSLSVVREMAQVPSPSATRRTLVALGNPTLGATVAERSHSVLMDSPLEPLPEAERQVRALGRMYGSGRSEIYVGEAASEERLKASAGGYRVLHIATHGVLSDTSPMYSHLVLSQTAKGSEDGLLEAREILGLGLNADLAVLSACETGRGRIGAGEGVIGLTWALFVAGCPRTVVSQWKVESASTTALMVALHRRLKPKLEADGSRLGAAEALRQAALEVMRDERYRHPFYWAGFVLVGDGS